MKVSDYIVEFLIKKGITDVFGYPGGMVTHLMDSLSKYSDNIQAHICYHEQAASFAACGYAQAANKVGVAYATSGPGATNMITGICNAYFDSIPVIFITGQVNTFESKDGYNVRQRGFQETDIIDMVKNVTKYSVYVDNAQKIAYYLEKAYQIAISERRGPVLLDIPLNIQSMDIIPELLDKYKGREEKLPEINYAVIIDELKKAEKPCILLGAGLKGLLKENVINFVEHMKIPVVSSMVAMDLLPRNHPLNYGFIGAYGSRTANFIVAKSDLILALGSRMDLRQVGSRRADFAPGAVIIRIDIDKNELDYQVREDEIDIQADVKKVMEYLEKNYCEEDFQYRSWQQICEIVAEKLNGVDNQEYNIYVEKISKYVSEDMVITTDVGQNQVWVAQSYLVKRGQQILFSGGHGAMGYSMPAAVGAYYALHKPVICFNGDGGIQMNIQELEFIRRERLPIKIFVFNNYALGMIRHFQEMYFKGNYVQTICGKGYDTPDFEKIAYAYDISYISYDSINDVTDQFMTIDGPVFVEIKLKKKTYVFPKLEYGKPNQDQEPLLDRRLYNYLMELESMERYNRNNGRCN